MVQESTYTQSVVDPYRRSEHWYKVLNPASRAMRGAMNFDGTSCVRLYCMQTRMVGEFIGELGAKRKLELGE